LLIEKAMKESVRKAFIMDHDEFVRLSLNKILRKYGFEVEEIEDFSQLEGRKKEIEAGMILADVGNQDLERWSLFLKKWNDRFILMTALVADELNPCLEKTGICHILKKPVEPKALRKVIRKISFPNGGKPLPSEKKGKS